MSNLTNFQKDQSVVPNIFSHITQITHFLKQNKTKIYDSKRRDQTVVSTDTKQYFYSAMQSKIQTTQ